MDTDLHCTEHIREFERKCLTITGIRHPFGSLLKHKSSFTGKYFETVSCVFLAKASILSVTILELFVRPISPIKSSTLFWLLLAYQYFVLNLNILKLKQVCFIVYEQMYLNYLYYYISILQSLFEGRKEMFYLTTHSTHFIYGYMASDIWLRTILIVRKETRCRHIGYSFRLAARVLLYAPSHRQDNTYHGLCYTSRGALAGTRNSSMGSLFETTSHLLRENQSYLPK